MEEEYTYEIPEESVGVGMPQLNPDSFASQLFWLAIVFMFLYLVMARSVIPRIRDVLGKRQNQIEHDLATAEKARQEAGSAQASYEAELAASRQKASSLLEKTQQEIGDYISAEQQKLQDTLDAMLEKSEASIAEQREAAQKEITPLVQELTGQIAAHFLAKKPTKTAINKAMKAAEKK